MQPKNFHEYLPEIPAAEFLGLSHRTLQRWRVDGAGPRFYKLGRAVRYRLDDLQAWAEEQARRSTSDSGRQAA